MDANLNPPESEATDRAVEPATVEIALARHPKVLEVVVVARADPQHGKAWMAFVVPKHGITPSPQLRDELWQSLTDEVGAIESVNDLRFADALPKTRAGKILRRTLQEMANN